MATKDPAAFSEEYTVIEARFKVFIQTSKFSLDSE
jgi:hypothetical protein